LPRCLLAASIDDRAPFLNRVGNHPATIQEASYDHPATIQEASYDHPATIREASYDHPATIQEASRRHPATILDFSLRVQLQPLHEVRVEAPLPTLLDSPGLVAVSTCREPSSGHPRGFQRYFAGPPIVSAYGLRASSETHRGTSSRVFQTGIRRELAPLRDVFLLPTLQRFSTPASTPVSCLPRCSGLQAAARSRSHSARPPSRLHAPSTN
jgi:hypothetical protein